MQIYMNDNFLLHSKTARHLYYDYAASLPIIDYHCHIPPQEIYEDRHFKNITEVWLGGHMKRNDNSDYYFGDHYKWRLMRANGVSEDYITGDQPDYERFLKFVEVLEKTIGNPMNHWCQLELKKYFGITEPLSTKNAKIIWSKTKDMLQNDPACTVRGLINRSNVAFIGTTDDPVDNLKWHQLIKQDTAISYTVAPSFRPDKALNIHLKGFKEYMHHLSNISDISIKTAQDAIQALEKRLECFVSMGCRASDHGIEAVPDVAYSYIAAESAFQKAMQDEQIIDDDRDNWQAYLLTELGKMYAKNHVVMQIHYNALRNTNTEYFKKLGPDTGFDAMDAHNCIHGLRRLLDTLTKANECPRMVLYSLNPKDMDALAALANCFQQNADIPSRIQLGAPWWFLDTKDGMENHLHTLGRLGVLGNFIGMLTDSRSFLSYTRHEYFRRILCNVIGEWVENGEFQDDDELLKNIVEGICYYNAKNFFSL